MIDSLGLLPDDDTRPIRESLRALLEKRCGPDLVRRVSETQGECHDSGLWSDLAGSGWLGVAVAEQYGGSGGNTRDLAAILEEAGRALVPTTFSSTLYFVLLLSSAGTTAQREQFLPPIAEGQLIATVADAEDRAYLDTSRYTFRIVLDSGGAELTGDKWFTQNACVADVAVVLGRRSDSDALGAAICTLDAPGLSRRAHDTFGRDCQSQLTFRAVRAGELDNDPQSLSRVMQTMTVLHCAEMIGGTQRVLEMATQHVTTRHQFGQAVGSFQAVQHHLANILMDLDAARLLVAKALDSLEAGENRPIEVSQAKVSSNRAYGRATVMAHQLMGGMGYVTEGDLYLWSRRAKSAEFRFGATPTHLATLAGLTRDGAVSAGGHGRDGGDGRS